MQISTGAGTTGAATAAPSGGGSATAAGFGEALLAQMNAPVETDVPAQAKPETKPPTMETGSSGRVAEAVASDVTPAASGVGNSQGNGQNAASLEQAETSAAEPTAAVPDAAGALAKAGDAKSAAREPRPKKKEDLSFELGATVMGVPVQAQVTAAGVVEITAGGADLGALTGEQGQAAGMAQTIAPGAGMAAMTEAVTGDGAVAAVLAGATGERGAAATGNSMGAVVDAGTRESAVKVTSAVEDVRADLGGQQVWMPMEAGTDRQPTTQAIASHLRTVSETAAGLSAAKPADTMRDSVAGSTASGTETQVVVEANRSTGGVPAGEGVARGERLVLEKVGDEAQQVLRGAQIWMEAGEAQTVEGGAQAGMPAAGTPGVSSASADLTGMRAELPTVPTERVPAGALVADGVADGSAASDVGNGAVETAATTASSGTAAGKVARVERPAVRGRVAGPGAVKQGEKNSAGVRGTGEAGSGAEAAVSEGTEEAAPSSKPKAEAGAGQTVSAAASETAAATHPPTGSNGVVTKVAAEAVQVATETAQRAGGQEVASAAAITRAAATEAQIYGASAAQTAPWARLNEHLGQGEMRVALHSEDFGAISVDAVLRSGGLNTTVHVDHPELRALLAGNLAELRSALAGHQLELSSFSVSTDAGGQPSGQSSGYTVGHGSARSVSASGSAKATPAGEAMPAAAGFYAGRLNVHA